MTVPLKSNVGIEFKPNKKQRPTKQIKSDLTSQMLCKQFNLTTKELEYMNAISLIGSSKDIARAINKSPRTIEKMVQNLVDKLKLQNKNQLQIFAKIITSHLHHYKEQAPLNT